MTRLPYSVDRTIAIRAGREAVFQYFTDSTRWSRWWGAGSTIDPRVGGRLFIRHPNGVEMSGEVLEIDPPSRIVFTMGNIAGKPLLADNSRVTIRLDDERGETRLHLRHEFADEPKRDESIQGWRYQLAVFSNVVADEIHANAAALVDGWFDAWAAPDPAVCEQTLARVASPSIRFGDRHSLVEGVADLVPHIMAAQRFMPGIRLRRRGEVRQCLGTVLADWVALADDGRELATGTNVFVLGADGRIESATGFWTPPKP